MVCNTDRVACGPVCGVGVGWEVVCNNDCYERSCLWCWGGVGWGGVGFATQTVLCAVLSVGLGWGGVCNNDRVTCSPVYVGGGGEGGVCNNDCNVQSYLEMGFATQTVLRVVLSVGVGWGYATHTVTCDPVCGVGWGFATQTVLHAILYVGWGGVGWGWVWCATHTVTCDPVCGVGVWVGVCNTDRVTCGHVCGGGVGVCNTHGNV